MANPETSQLSAAIASFIDFLQQARFAVGASTLTLPAELDPIFASIFSTKDAIDNDHLNTLLSIMDGDGGDLFHRLDVKAILVFTGLLRLAQEGQSQQRGYSMLAEYLHESNATGNQQNNRVKTKKKFLGPRNTLASLNRFLNPDRSHHTRRAIGLFVLTLLSDCPETKGSLVKQCTDDIWLRQLPTYMFRRQLMYLRRSLGNLILSQESEVIKLLAGSIIREMLHHQVPEDKFWPINDTPAVVINGFPRAADQTSQWVWNFHSYLKEGVLQDDVHEVSTFARLIRLPDLEFEPDDESSILITVTTCLCFMIPASKTRSVVYLDIPLDKIAGIRPIQPDSQSQARSQLSQSQTIKPCCLEIELNNLQGWNHVLNAKSRHAESVVVVFDYPQDAQIINDAVLARQSAPFQTVSPDDLEYKGEDSNEKAIIHRADPTRLSILQADAGEEEEPDKNQLVAMASDAITYLPRSGASNDMHDRNVDVGHNGNANVVSQQPSTAQSQPTFNGIDGILDSIREMVPANQDSNIGRPRAPTNPPREAKQKAPLDDGASGGASNPLNTRERQHLAKQSARQSPNLYHQRQQTDGYDPLYDASPPNPKVKPLVQATTMPPAEDSISSQNSAPSRRWSQKLSRQLRDKNGQVQDIDHGRSLDAEVLSVQSDKPMHQRSLEQRPSSSTHEPKTKTRTSRKIDTKAKNDTQQRKTLPMSSHDEEYTPRAGTSGHKADRLAQAPKAIMVAGSRKREPLSKGPKPLSVSTSSHLLPDRTTRVSQKASAPKAKSQLSAADEEEEVNWMEDLQVDDADITTKTKKTKNLQPQAKGARDQGKKQGLQPGARPAKGLEKMKGPQPQAKIAKAEKRQHAPTEQRNQVLSGSIANVQASRPKRAAAVKASNKIQGLSDNFDKKHSPVKDAFVEEVVETTPVSNVAISAIKANEPGLDPSEVQTLPIASRKHRPPQSSAHTSGPSATIKAPNERVIAESSTQKTAQRNREPNAVAKPIAASVTAGDDPVDPPVMSQSEHVFPVSIDHAVLHEMVEDSMLANDETAQAIIEAPIEKDIENNLKHYAQGNQSTNAMETDQVSESYNADPKDLPMIQQVLVTPVEGGKIPDTIELAPSSDVVVRKKQHAVSTHAQRAGSPDPLTQGYVEEKVKAAKHPRPQDDFRLKSRQHHQAIGKEHASQLGEMDGQYQAEIQDEIKSPPAPKKKRFNASKLQAALSPLLVLSTPVSGRISAPITKVVNESANCVEPATVATANGGTSIHHGTSASKRSAKQKRSLEEDDPRRTKKSRASGWQPSLGPYSARPTLATPKNSKSAVDRKPRLVHFGPDGPKNQGIQSAQKGANCDDSKSRNSAKDVAHEPASSSKRKHVSMTDEQRVTADSTPNQKRRKINTGNPTLKWNDKGENASQRPDKSNATGQHGKPSSQSSRVNEHGSPMPFNHSRYTSLVAPVITPSLNDISDEDHVACQIDVAKELEPQLPIALNHNFPFVSEPKAMVASNTKHRPSSPNAPSSILTDMAAHRMQPSGHFVEIQTNSVVVPINPQDPFTGTSKDRPYNHFTETLRKSSDMHSKETKQSRAEQHENEIPNGDGKDGRKDDDADKTLVGESPSEDGSRSSTASESSSGSNSSESRAEAGVEPSDDDSDPGSEWFRELRPDHKNTLNVLYEISHALMRDLIDKETAITDLINDYRTGGLLRIDRFEAERDRNFELALAKQEKAKQELVELFRTEERKCAAEAGSSDKAVADLRSKLEAREQKVNASMKAALALCEET